MKRLWIALSILLLLLLGALWNAQTLAQLTGQTTQLLTHAEACAEAGQWEQARALTRQARQLWSGQDAYLHITLRHSDIDQIQLGFGEVSEFLQCREGGEYSAANARLITQLELVCQAEQLSIHNLF